MLANKVLFQFSVKEDLIGQVPLTGGYFTCPFFFLFKNPYA
jgi:hypothetical protein